MESISWFSDLEIIDSGVDPALVADPNYVKASPILSQIEGFDADFWGYSPKEAQLLDPQQRLFMECAWESLEDVEYDPLTYTGEISLYGGAATNTYLLNNIYPNRHQIDDRDNLQIMNLSSMGSFQVTTANDQDYLTTRTSYKLNLTGSSVNVQTACSTSLVTVHLACQSLLNSECDLALAVGVSVHSPQKMGYLYQEGMILSPDGHCRAFDAEAGGTIFGSGAGMVVPKVLVRAVEDGDRIYGVIKGSAVNNEGGNKVGYLAPNVDGQIRVISEAIAYADIDPQSVSYIEAHGTGTKLSDLIEITALSLSYHYYTRKEGVCAIGSVVNLAQSFLDRGKQSLDLSSFSSKQDDWQHILTNLAQLYTAGFEINWQAVTQNYNGNKISLPTYPFQRQRYWFYIPKKNYYQPIKQDTVHPLLGTPLSSPLKQTTKQSYLDLNKIAWLKYHYLNNKTIFPGTVYLEIAIALGIYKF